MGTRSNSRARWFVAAILVVLLTEAFVALDLVPISMLLPSSWWLMAVATFSVVALLTILGFFWVRGERRFTTWSLLSIAFLFAWPLGRVTNEVRIVAQSANQQQICLQSLNTLPAKKIVLAGRYNDGRNDYAIQVWFSNFAIRFIDQSQWPDGIAYIGEVDLSDTKVTAEHLKELASLRTVEMINLSGTSLSSESIGHLKEMKSLRLIQLAGAVVWDADWDANEKQATIEYTSLVIRFILTVIAVAILFWMSRPRGSV